MSSIITHQLRKAIAEAIYDDIFSRRNNYYYFFGRYPDSETIPTIPEETLEYEQTTRNHIVAAKKIYVSDVAFVVPRFDWVGETSYAKYSTEMTGAVVNDEYVNGELVVGGPKFYVYDSINNRVYKCINNNNGGVSTIRPFSTDPYDVTYNDGYVWRYMYSLPKSIRNKFLTSTHLPVFTALQKRYYSDGGIGEITIIKSGANYTQATVTIEVVGDGSGAVLEPVIINGQIGDIIVKNPGRDYTRAILKIIDSGSGTGAEAVVELNTGDLDSDQALVELLTIGGTVDTAEVISGGSGYLTTPTVAVHGDGTGALAEAILGTGTATGSITRIIITSKGEGYSYATLEISPPDALTGTSAAETRTNVSPFLGHGRNAIDELFADQLMFYSNITSDRLADFDVVSPYKQFGLIKNLRNLDYTSNIYDQVSPNRYQVEADFGPQVTFVGGGGTGAKGRVNVTGKYVSDIKIESAGEGYSSPPIVSFGVAPTSVSRAAGITTANFSAKPVAPFAVGSSVVVTGLSPSNFNGTYVVTSCSTTSVAWADADADATATGTGNIIVSGSGATAVATIFAKLNTVNLTYGGVGYASPPGVTITSSTGSKGVITATSSLGVGAVVITNTASSFADSTAVSFIGGTGSGATATAVVSGNKLVKINVTNPGSYSVIPTDVTFGVALSASADRTSTIATATFATQSVAPYSVGSKIVVTGFTPTTFNGTFTVTGCTTTTVSWADTNGATTASGTGSVISAGTVVETFTTGALTVDKTGDGYQTAPTLTFNGSCGISDIIVNDPGILFTAGSNPVLTITGGGGNGCTATAYVENCVRNIVISTAGSGYYEAGALLPTTTFTTISGNKPTDKTVSDVIVKQKSSNGSGTGATFKVTTTGSGATYTGVTTITLVSNGSGYIIGNTVTISGGALGGIDGVNDLTFTIATAVGVLPGVTFSGTGGAAATAVISGGKVVGITITNRGYGYTTAPTVTIAPPTTGIQAVATAVVGLGITHVNVTNPGTGYTSVPTVSVANNETQTRTGYKLTPVLGKATGTTTIKGYIDSVRLTANGDKYTSAPVVEVLGGSPDVPAVLYSKVVGEVSSIDIDEGGSGYSSRPTVIITGGEGFGASYVSNISTTTGEVTGCGKVKGGSNYVITKFADFTIGTLLIDEQLNEYTVHSAKTNLKTNSLIITSNSGSPVVGRMRIRKKNASDYFITNTALSQKFLESRFPVACYTVRGSFSLGDYPEGTVVTLTDQANGDKTFIVISSKEYDTSLKEMLLLPIDGGTLNNGVTLSNNGANPFSVVSYNKPALDRRTGELLMISNNDSSFTQNSDQTLSFRTIINF